MNIFLDSGPLEVVEHWEEPDWGRDFIERHKVPAVCCKSSRKVGRNQALSAPRDQVGMIWKRIFCVFYYRKLEPLITPVLSGIPIFGMSNLTSPKLRFCEGNSSTKFLFRLMREDFWPFVSACAVVICSCLLVGAYAVKRTWFTDQKVDFVPKKNCILR